MNAESLEYDITAAHIELSEAEKYGDEERAEYAKRWLSSLIDKRDKLRRK